MTNAELLFAYDHYDEQHHGDIRAEILRLMDRGRLEHGQGALRKAIKITLGRASNIPWYEITDVAVDAYASEIIKQSKPAAPPEQPQDEPTFCSAGLADRGEPYRYEHHWTAPIFSKPADPARGQQFPNEASLAKMQELVTRAAQPQMSAREFRNQYGFSANDIAKRWAGSQAYELAAEIEAFAEAFARSRDGGKGNG